MQKNSSNNLPVVEVNGLVKIFRDFWGRPKARAVNGIDFKVQRGEVFGLLGPNGSGKSTTVKMLLGLLYPNRGNIRVLGEEPRHVKTKRRIGYLPEETYLYRYLTATETLDFFGSLFELTTAERRRRTGQLLEMVGLNSAKNRRVGEFSKGMARRIGLAQALINDPDVVILDEPTSGLDPIGCREVKDLIQLLADRGKTIILSSHLLADVEDVCDQVVMLYGGKIRVHGSLKQLLRVDAQTRICLPSVSGEALADLKQMLASRFAADQIKIDQPTKTLEELFLEEVSKARLAQMETAGAQAGGRIADYLQAAGAATTAEDSAEARIRAALQTNAEAVAEAEAERQRLAAAAAQAQAAASVQAKSQTKLNQLRADDRGPQSDTAAAAAPPSRELQTNAANQRLQQLLNHQQDDDKI